MLHRFPGYDHEGDGCAFPANLPLFCLPGGLKLGLEMALPTFFTFVHTRANGQHMFGYCFCLHEVGVGLELLRCLLFYRQRPSKQEALRDAVHCRRGAQ